MRRSALLPVALVSLVVLIGAVGLQSAPRFSGLRWHPGSLLAPSAPARPANIQASEPVPSQPPGQTSPTQIDLGPFAIAFLLIAATVLAVLLLRWYLRRRVPAPGYEAESTSAAADAGPAPEPEQPSAPVLRRAFANALDALDADRTPRDSIVTAWLALQDAAATSGIRRRAAETPTEFTARILRRVPADVAAVETLLTAYQNVRFGGRTPDAADIERVRRSLQTLSASWDQIVASPGLPS